MADQDDLIKVKVVGSFSYVGQKDNVPVGSIVHVRAGRIPSLSGIVVPLVLGEEDIPVFVPKYDTETAEDLERAETFDKMTRDEKVEDESRRTSQQAEELASKTRAMESLKEQDEADANLKEDEGKGEGGEEEGEDEKDPESDSESEEIGKSSSKEFTADDFIFTKVKTPNGAYKFIRPDGKSAHFGVLQPDEECNNFLDKQSKLAGEDFEVVVVDETGDDL